jgi:hypothetical protein
MEEHPRSVRSSLERARAEYWRTFHGDGRVRGSHFRHAAGAAGAAGAPAATMDASVWRTLKSCLYILQKCFEVVKLHKHFNENNV